jgi:hypothetical protein
MRYLMIVAVALAAPVNAAAPDSYQALLAADRAFSEQGRDKPLSEALGVMFAPDAVLVSGGSPILIRGADAIRARLAANPESSTAKIEWSPVGGGISADETQGFTYGGMTMRPASGAPQQLKYLAYWVKGPAGWRVFAYKRLQLKAGVALVAAEPVLGRGGKRADNAKASLTASEAAFSADAQQVGLRAAFKKWGRPDSINIGASEGVTIGARAIGEGVAGTEPVSPVTWAADEAIVAGSGDMGLTYGLLHLNTPRADGRATIPFFTVWARPRPGDPWRYIAE